MRDEKKIREYHQTYVYSRLFPCLFVISAPLYSTLLLSLSTSTSKSEGSSKKASTITPSVTTHPQAHSRITQHNPPHPQSPPPTPYISHPVLPPPLPFPISLHSTYRITNLTLPTATVSLTAPPHSPDPIAAPNSTVPATPRRRSGPGFPFGGSRDEGGVGRVQRVGLRVDRAVGWRVGRAEGALGGACVCERL